MEITRWRAAIVAGLVVAAAPRAHAGINRWTRVGPEAVGRVASLTIDTGTPTTIYAATDGAGVFKSTNAGATWSPANDGLQGFRSGGMIVAHPTAPSTLYTTTFFGARSIDAGGSWSPLGFLPGGIETLAVDPQSPTTMYAAANAYRGGTYASNDSGTTWTQLGLDASEVRALVVDPQTPSTIYAVVTDDGLKKTVDAGSTWQAINDGLPSASSDPSTFDLTAFALDPSSPQTLYVGAASDPEHDPLGGGLFTSSDGGATWQRTLGDLPPRIQALVVDSHDSSTIYGVSDDVLFKTTDRAATWARRDAGLPTVDGLLIDPVDATNLYAWGWHGIFKSVDGGASWYPSNAGLTLADVQTLVTDPRDAAVMYAGSAALGVLTPTDHGTTWSPHDVGFDEERSSRLLPYRFDGPLVATDPHVPGVVYAETGSGLYKSTDGAGSWSKLTDSNDLANRIRCIAAFAVHPRDGTVYAGMAKGGVCQGGVARSIDGGVTWTMSALTDVAVAAITLDPLDGDLVYAGVVGGGVLRSTDAGRHWQEIGPQPFHTGDILAVDPLNPATLYVLSVGIVYKSVDRGRTWRVTSDADGTRGIVLDASNPAVVYRFGDAVARSADGGTTWTRLTAGLADTTIQALALDGANPARLWAAPTESSLFQLEVVTPCASDGACDDGLSCTADQCDPSGRCVNRALTGFASVQCALDSEFHPIACTGNVIPIVLGRLVRNAAGAARKASASDTDSRAVLQLTRAARFLKRALIRIDRPTRALSPECIAALHDQLAEAEGRTLTLATRLRAH